MGEDKYVLAMYDVRGIQDYIFRTSKVKDAIGASAIVEDIIESALEDSCKNAKDISDSDYELRWHDDSAPLPYSEEAKKISVLYIGGGNAYVMYESKSLAVEISRSMAKFMIDHTYSLQLATAIVEKTNSYKTDYEKLTKEMFRVKDQMIVSKPLGALPIMEVEKMTGFPVTDVEEYKGNSVRLSKESLLKRREAKKRRGLYEVSEQETILDSYILKKGIDSTIAVVHIDGNNMGTRINKLIEGIESYSDAINRMREISFNINNHYKTVFEDMARYFNSFSGAKKGLGEKELKDYFVMKILTAGDDITYICNSKIALSTVEYFVKHISDKGMVDNDPQNRYKFSVCAGIAYINSHFPFNIGYEVAEACCESAKDRAKESENRSGDKVGNWVDFQICKNIQTTNLKETRRREYITRSGEHLLKRPYYIHTNNLLEKPFKDLKNCEESLGKFKENMKNISGAKDSDSDKKKMGRSFLKNLRNTYPLGEGAVNQLVSFMKSRRRDLPDEMYYTNKDNDRIAIYYDALEMMDYYVDIFEEKEALQ